MLNASGIILGVCLGNERQCSIVRLSLIGWVHIQNAPSCISIPRNISSTHFHILYCRDFMNQRCAATGEEPRQWTLQSMVCSLQEDSTSCGIFVLMVSMCHFSIGEIHNIVWNLCSYHCDQVELLRRCAPCGHCGSHRVKRSTTRGSARSGAIFDIDQTLAHLVNRMIISQYYLGCGHFVRLFSFHFRAIELYYIYQNCSCSSGWCIIAACVSISVLG